MSTARVLIACVILLLTISLLVAIPHAVPVTPFEDRYRSISWEEIVTEARGQTIFFFMWGGSAPRNVYVNDFVERTVKILYNVTLKQVPVTDTVQAVNKVIGEKQVGKLRDGSVDLIWINGENFRTAREAKVLFGPWADLIPNSRFIDWSDPSVAFDFGYPVEFYESPWGAGHFVFEYDSARVSKPPTTVDALFRWIRENPGRFTYPAPPDFRGTRFVEHLFHWAAGNPKRLLGPFNERVYAEVAPKVWQVLNELKPFLWRRGITYPESGPKLVDLLAAGEVDFSMTNVPGQAVNLILAGRYPKTIRTHVFETGTIGGTNYLAIPFNSSQKAAAMVVANFMLGPEAQFEAMKPEVLGQLTPLTIDRLPKVWQDRFASLPRHEATLPPEVLNKRRLPQLQATWTVRIEKDWIANVLQR